MHLTTHVNGNSNANVNSDNNNNNACSFINTVKVVFILFTCLTQHLTPPDPPFWLSIALLSLLLLSHSRAALFYMPAIYICFLYLCKFSAVFVLVVVAVSLQFRARQKVEEKNHFGFYKQLFCCLVDWCLPFLLLLLLLWLFVQKQNVLRCQAKVWRLFNSSIGTDRWSQVSGQ